MIDLKACPECGAPEYITSEFLWLDNGDIVQLRAQGNRMVLVESENFNPLFSNIEKISGVSPQHLEHIAINSACLAVRQHVSLLIPEEVRGLIKAKELDPTPIAMAMIDVSTMFGYGRHELVDFRLEGDDRDFYSCRIFEPYSVPLYCGTIAGTVEAITGYNSGARYEELSPDVYRVDVFQQPHPEGLKERIWSQRYQRRSGDSTLERCATCGGPRALSGYQWDAERSVILNRSNGRRLVLMGLRQLDCIFRELEMELGDTFPGVVVEAQRRFTMGGFYSLQDVKDADDFGNQLALRGLGNLRELDMSKRGLHMRLDNTALHLMMVGMIQGVFDAAQGVDSNVEWELSEEGNLVLEIIPASKPTFK